MSTRPPTDEDMYAAIARAWCRRLSPAQRRQRPLRRHVLAPGFIRTLTRAGADAVQVATLCAQLACGYRLDPDSSQLLERQRPPQRALDPMVEWWHPLPGAHGELGVHYAELAGGTLEFLSVGRRDDRGAGGEVG